MQVGVSGYFLAEEIVIYFEVKKCSEILSCAAVGSRNRFSTAKFGFKSSQLSKKNQMKIIIFGATGMVGKYLVKQALYNGYSVKAYGRNVFTENLPKDDNLELVQGALFDGGQVLKAIKGCDAVLSALGGGADGSDKTRSLGMKNIVEQMEKAGVQRIVAIGGMGLLNAPDDTLLIDQESYPQQYVAVGREHQKALGFLQASKLNWTMVCPPDIIEADATGMFHSNADYPPTTNNYKINAGDLALFMLKELQQNEFQKKRVGISN